MTRSIKYWVIDGYFSPEWLDDVLAEWPEMSVNKSGETSVKSIESRNFGPRTASLINSLLSTDFIEYLERLTGEKNLVGDPYLVGGGLHEIKPGGFLNYHIDFNWNPRINAVRKMNVLIYLNKNWTSNGNLEFPTENVSISPIFNRMVIFKTDENSWHGHPEPLNGDRSRKSIALYYYRHEPKPDVCHTTIYGSSATLCP